MMTTLSWGQVCLGCHCLNHHLCCQHHSYRICSTRLSFSCRIQTPNYVTTRFLVLGHGRMPVVSKSGCAVVRRHASTKNRNFLFPIISFAYILGVNRMKSTSLGKIYKFQRSQKTRSMHPFQRQPNSERLKTDLFPLHDTLKY